MLCILAKAQYREYFSTLVLRTRKALFWLVMNDYEQWYHWESMCCLFYFLFLIKDNNIVIVSHSGTPMEFPESIVKGIKKRDSTLGRGLLKLNYSSVLKVSK